MTKYIKNIYLLFLSMMLCAPLLAQNIKFVDKPIASENDSFNPMTEGAVAVADIDGDGDQDMLMAEYDGGKGAINLYRNSGNGNFDLVNGTVFQGVVRGKVAFADMDNDNDQDAIVVGAKHGGTLYLNNGKGDFKQALDATFLGVDFGALALADVDNDNDQDVLITGLDARLKATAALYLNDGEGIFKAVDTNIGGVSRGAVAFSDVDGDGDQDLLVVGLDNKYNHTAKLYQNDGTGQFQLVENTPFLGAHGSDIAFVDVDGDNDQDVVITGLAKGGVETLVYENDGEGNYTEAATLGGVRDGEIAIADMDGDQVPDMLLTGVDNQGQSVAKLYQNDGSGSFQEVAGVPLTGVGAGGGLALVDADGDNDLDVMIVGKNTEEGSTARLYKNYGSLNYATTEEELLNSPFAGQLEVYPNPNQGRITIALGSSDFTGAYEVYNVLGAKIAQGEIAQTTSVNIDINQPKGVYFLHIAHLDGREYVYKLMKE